jgi:hypothetical protein
LRLKIFEDEERVFITTPINTMASQSVWMMGKGLLQPIRLSLLSSYTAAASQRTAINSVNKKYYSYTTSKPQAKPVFKPSSPRNAKDPSPTAAPLSNDDAPSNSPNLEVQDLTAGYADQNLVLDEGSRQVDWTRSFHGLSAEPFSKETAEVLTQPIPEEDVEVKPDGIVYLPEIKYRRILNRAFGPGGWGLAPRGETIVTSRSVTREYALVVLGRYVYTRRPLGHLVLCMLTASYCL